MALEGTLRDFSFADILQLISLQRKTGVLTLKAADNVVTISFLDGHIVGANSLSQHLEDRLGLILLKRGIVGEAELEAALRRQEETLQRLGRILIDHALCSAANVRQALEQQMLQIVYRVFRWADGEYHFSQETDIDYDRELVVPMPTDSIIMEGARMTDEWPFIDQRIPDRDAVFAKVDSNRKLEVVDDKDEDFDDLGFSFTDTPDDAAVVSKSEDKVTQAQKLVYDSVDGRHAVNELIQESPLIEFDTCKALADLLDRSLVRKATPEEVTRLLRREEAESAAKPAEARPLAAVPWLALPFLVLLGFSLTLMSHNPIDPTLTLKQVLWDEFHLDTVSWMRMDSLGRSAETSYLLHGLYPESIDELCQGEGSELCVTEDPWGREYRLSVTDTKLIVTGADHTGTPVLLSRRIIDEGQSDVPFEGPGVILIES